MEHSHSVYFSEHAKSQYFLNLFPKYHCPWNKIRTAKITSWKNGFAVTYYNYYNSCIRVITRSEERRPLRNHDQTQNSDSISSHMEMNSSIKHDQSNELNELQKLKDNTFSPVRSLEDNSSPKYEVFTKFTVIIYNISEGKHLTCLSGNSNNDAIIYGFSNGLIGVYFYVLNEPTVQNDKSSSSTSTSTSNETSTGAPTDTTTYTSTGTQPNTHNERENFASDLRNNRHHTTISTLIFGYELQTHDNSILTCVIWYTRDIFFAIYESGYMYAFYLEWIEELPEDPFSMNQTEYSMIEKMINPKLQLWKNNAQRNPFFRISIGKNVKVHNASFSSDRHYLALACNDGFLRIYDIEDEDYCLHIAFRSYFGQVLSCCWTQDNKYVIAGGEDDYVTIYSIDEKKVICRGKGHRNFVLKVEIDRSFQFSNVIRIVSCSRDCTLLVWEVDIGNIKSTLTEEETIASDDQEQMRENLAKKSIIYPPPLRSVPFFQPVLEYRQNVSICDFAFQEKELVTINEDGDIYLYRLPDTLVNIENGSFEL